MLDSKTLCYPGQQNSLLSRIAKLFAIQDSNNIFFAIQDSKTIKFLLSWIAKLFATQDSKKKYIFAILDSKMFYYPGQQNNLKNLQSRIGKQIAIFTSLDSKTFAIKDSKTIQKNCYLGQQNNSNFLLSWIGKLLLCWIAKLFAIQDSNNNKNLLSRIAKQ